MTNPIHLPDGTYNLLPGHSMVFDLGPGQDTVSVTNNNAHGVGSFMLSINHSPSATHTLNPGTSFNINAHAGDHFHIDNNGAVALEVDIA